MKRDAEPVRVVRRDKFIYGAFKFLVTWGYHKFTSPVIEQENLPEIRKLREQNPRAIFLYAGLHKSLWETTGIPVALIKSGLSAPYVVMGDNLVHGNIFRHIAQQIGAILIKRTARREEMIGAAINFKKILSAYLKAGIDILVFPEGTRTNIPKTGQYGVFYSTLFDTLLDYEKQKDAIPPEERSASPEIYIVPCNTDYSNVREAKSFIQPSSRKAQTLRIWDSLKMLAHIRAVHVSFGLPIRVADHLDKNRKQLSAFTKEKCLNLVKILSINVLSKAILDTLATSSSCPRDLLEKNIKNTVRQLGEHKSKFRGFTPDSTPREIYDHAVKIGKFILPITPEKKALYCLYAAYIRHYFPASK